MNKCIGSLLVVLLLCVGANAQSAFNFTINTTQGRKPISPYIYGTNDAYPYAGAKRLGGNRLSGYNWENNASNAGEDLNHQNDHYVPWILGVPTAQYNIPGSALTHFHAISKSQGAYSLITLPMAGYVAADAKETSVGNAPSLRWKKVVVSKPAPLSLNPNLADSAIFVDEEINFLINKLGASNTGGIKGYALDNEPALWPTTHPRLFGTKPLRVDTLMRRSIELAKRIKELDPTAEVFGSAAYGFNEYLDLQAAPDWNAVNAGKYKLFIEYYLAEMKRQSNLVGHRLLDVLDLHWYPETNLTSGTSPFDDGIDPATNKARMDMPRSLWDPSYVENTWIGNEYGNTILPLLPKLKQYIALHNPGTKLALSEYSYMGGAHASGGIAQADALGIFGQQELYFATYWGGVTDYIKAGFDIYRNYDGKGGQFGNTSVQAASNNQEFSSVYASVDNSDASKLHIVAMNKDQDSAHEATIAVNSPINFKSARVWMFDQTGAVIRQLKNIRVINGNTFQVTLPALSVYHFVLTTEDLSLHPFFENASINPIAGYSDGTSSFTITAEITDGDNDITTVTTDLSSVGGSANQVLTRSGNIFTCTYSVPAGTVPGLRNFVIKAQDAQGHIGEQVLSYRVIERVPPLKIWDGDLLEAGEPIILNDPNDSKEPLLKLERRLTGGNEEPGSLFMHMEHDDDKWNIFTFRFDEDNNSTTVTRDVSNYEFVEFYIKSNAPAKADIDFSLGDYNLDGSNLVYLKKDGYLSSFSNTGYTRVRIPFSVLTKDKTFDLAKLWQVSFGSNTADKGFDVWVDDIRVIPFSHPAHQPQIRDSIVTPVKNFADGLTSVTISADVTDPDGDLQTVTVDLSTLNGPNNAAMTFANGRYTLTYYLPAAIPKGNKLLTITATDAASNSAQASLPFLIYQKVTSDTVWNGDSKPMGAVEFTNNAATYARLRSTGGNYRPGVLQMHLQETAGDQYANVVWDWNEGTNDENIQDATQKRYIQFYIKVVGSQTQPNFDFQFYLRDPFAEFSKSVNIKGGQYVSTFTGNYQLVRIPLDSLLKGTRVDRSQLTHFGIYAEDVRPTNGIDVFIDDITLTGSIAADVLITSQDANCGKNGAIRVANINNGTGNYSYFINGFPNATEEFKDLDPGNYDIKVMGNSDFVYVESIQLRGYSGINAAINTSGKNITLSVTNGLGNYSYLWSNGATTKDLSNMPDGLYIVTVTDNLTGCTTSARAVIGNSLPFYSLPFRTELSLNGIAISWSGLKQSNLSSYEIWHSSNGRAFTLISKVTANLDREIAEEQYEFVHNSPNAGKNYYRINLIFNDGKSMLTETKMQLYSKKETQRVQVIPNPAHHTALLKTNLPVSEVSITDILGVRISDFTYRKSSEGVLLNIGTLAPGSYIISIRHSNEVSKVKLTKL